MKRGSVSHIPSMELPGATYRLFPCDGSEGKKSEFKYVFLCCEHQSIGVYTSIITLLSRYYHVIIDCIHIERFLILFLSLSCYIMDVSVKLFFSYFFRGVHHINYFLPA